MKELIAFMQAENPGEPSHFTVEESSINAFLAERGFQVLHHQAAKELEQDMVKIDPRFSDPMTAFFCIVHASS